MEEKFNQILTQITEVLSDGRLTGISIVDLPAFGSKLDQLEKDHQISPIWPSEINFALRDAVKGNISETFFLYKTLLDDWKQHMKTMHDTDPKDTFTHQMAHNEFMNFTQFIKEDMKSFLLAVAGKKSAFFFSSFIKNMSRAEN